MYRCKNNENIISSRLYLQFYLLRDWSQNFFRKKSSKFYFRLSAFALQTFYEMAFGKYKNFFSATGLISIFFTKPCRCIISHHNELFSFGRISRRVRRIPCCTLHFSASHTESHMLPRDSNRGSISCDCKSPVPVHHPGCRRNRDDGTSGTALLGRSTSGAPSAIPFCNIKLRPGMSTLREAHRRTFGSIGKKKIDAISEANYPVNFVESEQIDSWKIHGSAYFSSRAKVFSTKYELIEYKSTTKHDKKNTLRIKIALLLFVPYNFNTYNNTTLRWLLEKLTQLKRRE